MLIRVIAGYMTRLDRLVWIGFMNWLMVMLQGSLVYKYVKPHEVKVKKFNFFPRIIPIIWAQHSNITSWIVQRNSILRRVKTLHPHSSNAA